MDALFFIFFLPFFFIYLFFDLMKLTQQAQYLIPTRGVLVFHMCCIMLVEAGCIEGALHGVLVFICDVLC